MISTFVNRKIADIMLYIWFTCLTFIENHYAAHAEEMKAEKNILKFTMKDKAVLFMKCFHLKITDEKVAALIKNYQRMSATVRKDETILDEEMFSDNGKKSK